MHASSSHGPTTLRRLLLLAASLTIGIFIWHILGDTEGLVAEEKPQRASVDGSDANVAGSEVLAHVDGVAITDQDVEGLVAEELADLEARRHQLIASALESQIVDQLIDAEAVTLGVDRETLLSAEVEAKLDQVEESQVEALYAERVYSEPLAAVEIELRRQLRLQAYVTDLRQRAAVEYQAPS